MLNLAVSRSDSETNLTQDDVIAGEGGESSLGSGVKERPPPTAAGSVYYNFGLHPHVQVRSDVTLIS